MSTTNSISTDSTSSMNEQKMDPSNILYNDHQNYQIIFTNDSRFFDTSLHLFKSYCDLGYIQLNDKKSKKKLNTLKPQANGHENRSRSQTGFSSNHNFNGNHDATLKPPFSRKHGKHLFFLNFKSKEKRLFHFYLDHSISQRSDPGATKLTVPQIKRDNSHVAVSHQQQRASTNRPVANGNSSDDPDIIVTRL